MKQSTPGCRHRGVFLCLALLCALTLAGCAQPWTDGTGDAHASSCIAELPPASSGVTGIFVQPDDGYPAVLTELENAACTIDVTIYMLTDDVIFAALLAAESRDVRVRVILDQYPYGMFGDQQEARDRLEAGGADVIWSSKDFRFTHAKYIVIDGRVALIMNQNLTGAAFNSNREFGVVTTDPGIVEQVQTLFDADWAHDVAPPVDGPLITSPETSRSRITALIHEAGTSIDFYAEVIRDEHILDALGNAVERGVTVRLIVNQSVDPADLEAIAALALIGVDVRMMPSLYIHSKVMIFDGETALVGSQNYTMTSLDRNRELGIIVDDPQLLARITAVYERDWRRTIPATSAFTEASSGAVFRSEPGRYPFVPRLPVPVGVESDRPLDRLSVSVYSVRTVPKGWVHGRTNRRSSRRTLLRGVVHNLGTGGGQDKDDTRCGALYRNHPGRGFSHYPPLGTFV